MKLHLANTDDGYMIWGVFLTGRHNDGDGGIDIYHEWFMVANSEQKVRDALSATVEAKKRSYRLHQPLVAYRPVSPMELVLCSRSPGGRLSPVTLAGGSAVGVSVTPALIDTRG